VTEHPDASCDFMPEDYSFTAQLLRDYARLGPPKMFQAVCSNNLNIILAALDAAAERKP
jgi:hypothetical protein